MIISRSSLLKKIHNRKYIHGMYIFGDADRHSTGFTDVTCHALDETYMSEMSLKY